jgi:hypothetical protein
VLAENSSSSCTSVTAGRRKFKYWCKELAWLSFDQNTGVANCKLLLPKNLWSKFKK